MFLFCLFFSLLPISMMIDRARIFFHGNNFLPLVLIAIKITYLTFPLTFSVIITLGGALATLTLVTFSFNANVEVNIVLRYHFKTL